MLTYDGVSPVPRAISPNVGTGCVESCASARRLADALRVYVRARACACALPPRACDRAL